MICVRRAPAVFSTTWWGPGTRNCRTVSWTEKGTIVTSFQVNGGRTGTSKTPLCKTCKDQTEHQRKARPRGTSSSTGATLQQVQSLGRKKGSWRQPMNLEIEHCMIWMWWTSVLLFLNVSFVIDCDMWYVNNCKSLNMLEIKVVIFFLIKNICYKYYVLPNFQILYYLKTFFCSLL